MQQLPTLACSVPLLAGVTAVILSAAKDHPPLSDYKATITCADRCHPEPTAVILSAAKDLPAPSDYKFTIPDMGDSSITASQIITV